MSPQDRRSSYIIICCRRRRLIRREKGITIAEFFKKRKENSPYGALLLERGDTDFLRLQLRRGESGWDKVALIAEVEPFLELMEE